VRKILQRKLKGSPFGDNENIQRIMDAFEREVSP
jgi:hypothetical protein